MQIAFGVALLLLACAVVLLFAMFGELAAKVGPALDGAASHVGPLDGAKIGAVPSSWPEQLDQVQTADHTLLLALSTSCSTCQKVAEQVSAQDRPGYVIALACPDQGTGAEFIRAHGLAGLPYYLDPAGEWLRTELGVQESPASLVFQHGQLVSARVFTDIRALATTNAG